MKKILFATFAFANLSLLSMACEFHGGGGFSSRYDWPSDSYDSTSYDNEANSHANSPNENNKVSSNSDSRSEVKQPDFRYRRVSSSASSDDTANEEKGSKLD